MKAVVIKIQQLGLNLVHAGTVLDVLTTQDLLARYPQGEWESLQRGRMIAEPAEYIWVSHPNIDHAEPFTIPLDRVRLLEEDEVHFYGVLFED